MKQKLHNGLRWSEKYTKTDMVFLTKGGSWLVLGSAISSIIVFVLAIVFANFLPKESYGMYKFVLSISSILTVATLSGIGVATTKAISNGHDKTIYHSFKTKIKWGVLASVLGLLISLYYFYNNNIQLGTSFIVVAILMPIMELFSLYQSILIGKKFFALKTIYQTIYVIGSSAAIATTTVLTNNVILILLSFFLSHTIIRALIFYKLRRDHVHKTTQTDTSIEDYGKHLTTMNVLGTIVNHIDKIIVFHFLGVVQMAVYAFAVSVPDQLKGVLKNISPLSFSKFSNKNITDIQSGINKKVFLYMIVVLIIIAIYIPIAPFIYTIFFPAYTDSILLSQIYSISLLGTAALIPGTALQAKEKTKQLYILNILRFVVYIPILFLFVIMYGMMGAVIATIIRRLLNLIVSMSLVNNTV